MDENESGFYQASSSGRNLLVNMPDSYKDFFQDAAGENSSTLNDATDFTKFNLVLSCKNDAFRKLANLAPVLKPYEDIINGDNELIGVGVSARIPSINLGVKSSKLTSISSETMQDSTISEELIKNKKNQDKTVYNVWNWLAKEPTNYYINGSADEDNRIYIKSDKSDYKTFTIDGADTSINPGILFPGVTRTSHRVGFDIFSNPCYVPVSIGYISNNSLFSAVSNIPDSAKLNGHIFKLNPQTYVECTNKVLSETIPFIYDLDGEAEGFSEKVRKGYFPIDSDITVLNSNIDLNVSPNLDLYVEQARAETTLNLPIDKNITTTCKISWFSFTSEEPNASRKDITIDSALGSKLNIRKIVPTYKLYLNISNENIRTYEIIVPIVEDKLGQWLDNFADYTYDNGAKVIFVNQFSALTLSDILISKNELWVNLAARDLGSAIANNLKITARLFTLRAP